MACDGEKTRGNMSDSVSLVGENSAIDFVPVLNPPVIRPNGMSHNVRAVTLVCR